ncbi:MAG: RNA polymerase sigma factor (sigma-70 family) [Flavobacteriales bacterium]|jgi:RNA polymerase sigma factor (sigma-70 family)
MSKNNESVNKVYLEIRSRLARIVSHIVPPKEVEDIVQETYVRVCQVDSERIQHPRSFLYRTARNLAFDHLKKAETRLVSSIDDEPDPEWLLAGDVTDETFERAAANQEFGNFCEAVRQLPQQCRKAFVLKKVYGYTQKEIAQQLELSESTVEKHIANGIKRCSLMLATQQSETQSPRRRAR